MAEIDLTTWSVAPQQKGPAGRSNIIEGITPDTWFSPLNPLPDFAPQNVAGRMWDYPVGYNLQVTVRPQSKITYGMLRQLVDRCDIMSVIINNRKDQTESRQWLIRQKQEPGEKRPPMQMKKAQVKKDPRIRQLTQFLERPDKVNTWDQWLRPLLDDLFVIDAPAIYVRRTRGGDIYGLEVMDGGTIALNVDENGRRPQPPSPAFKQILKGVPAISYTTDQLIYAPRNMKSWGVYGRSPVEQTMGTINAAINRALFNQNYYTEGNIPDAIGSLPDNFTPSQAAEFTNWWDSMYSGNLSQRRKVKFVPGLSHFEQLKAPELKNVYDDYIARILCFALGISPQPFISQMNRATAEVSKVSTDEEGKLPVQNWIKNIINLVIQGPQFFNMPDLEFEWEEEESTDPAQQATVLSTYVSKAVMTINESREVLGLEPDMHPSADELGIITASGFVTLEQGSAQADAQVQSLKSPKGDNMGEEGGEGSKKPSGTESSPPPVSKGLKKKSGIHTNLNRPAVHAAMKEVAKKVHSVLKKTGSSVANQLRSKLSKADIEINFDLSDLDGLDDATREGLEGIAADSGRIVLDQMGLVKQVNNRAVAWAAERSADLVSQIEETTREKLRKILSEGLADNVGRDQIIEDMQPLFSEDRAKLIADTEIANANSQGSLQGMMAARDAGVNVLKEWDATDEPCPICEGNEAQGPIPLEEDFESGDSAPLAHPNCRCVLLGITSD